MSTKRIIGIDFGTSTTVIRVKTYIDGVPEGSAVFSGSVKFDGRDTLPTLAFYDSTYDEYLMGDQAERELGNEQGEIFRNFKLDLLSSDPAIRQRAEDLIKRFFIYIYNAYDDQRNHFTPCDIETTYVSYPAKWPKELVDIMVQIAGEAGFKNVKGLDEPSAAMQTVFVQETGKLQKFGSGTLTILVLDMGAGTTDLALCRYTPGQKKADIINTWPKSEGYALFGGREIDEALWSYVKTYISDCGINNPPVESQMIPQAKVWKERTVSLQLKTNRPVEDCNFVNYLFTNNNAQNKKFPSVDRAVLENALEGYLQKFPELINGLLYNTAGVLPEDVDLVILTGGHSQWYFTDEILLGRLTKFGAVNLPKIQKESERIIRLSLPQETVALGLVYQGLAAEDNLRIIGKERKCQEQKQIIQKNLQTKKEEPIHKADNLHYKYFVSDKRSIWQSNQDGSNKKILFSGGRNEEIVNICEYRPRNCVFFIARVREESKLSLEGSDYSYRNELCCIEAITNKMKRAPIDSSLVFNVNINNTFIFDHMIYIFNDKIILRGDLDLKNIQCIFTEKKMLCYIDVESIRNDNVWIYFKTSRKTIFSSTNVIQKYRIKMSSGKTESLS